MPRPLPRTLRLPLHAVTSSLNFARHVTSTLHPRVSDVPRYLHTYAFKNDERAFALELLTRRTQLWLFRTHQGAACGDFVVVDLSSADPSLRRVHVLELKYGSPLREGGGSAGWQLRHTADALAELVKHQLITADAPVTVLAGDGNAILAHLGAGPRRLRPRRCAPSSSAMSMVVPGPSARSSPAPSPTG